MTKPFRWYWVSAKMASQHRKMTLGWPSSTWSKQKRIGGIVKSGHRSPHLIPTGLWNPLPLIHSFWRLRWLTWTARGITQRTVAPFTKRPRLLGRVLLPWQRERPLRSTSRTTKRNKSRILSNPYSRESVQRSRLGAATHRDDLSAIWFLTVSWTQCPINAAGSMSRRVKEIHRMKRNKQYGAWHSCPPRAMERGHFPGAHWVCRRSAEDGASCAY